LLGGAAFDAGGKRVDGVSCDFGGVGDIVAAGVDGEVEVVALSASAHGGVDRLPRHGLVDEDEGVVAGGALGLVDGHGVAVAEVAGFRIGERRSPARPVRGGDVDLAPLLVDGSDGASGAVEHARAVVVGQAENLVADGDVAPPDPN